MKRCKRLAVVVISLLFCAAISFGQSPPTKAYTFHGKVEAVNASAKTLTVNGEKVEGWMGAMTMDYKVDDPTVLTKLKPGDQIMATVYDRDPLLHKVRVMPMKDSSSK